MSIQPYNSQYQTSLVPQTLLGYSDNGVSALEITSTSIVLGGNLNTTPIYVSISTAGLTTTLATGLDVNCDFNMNQNDITNVSSIIQEGNDLNINTGVSALDINISAGSALNLTGDDNINLTSTNGKTYINLSGASSGDGELVCSNFSSGGDITLSALSGGVIGLNSGDNVQITAGENFFVNTNATTGIISLNTDSMNINSTNGLNMNLKNIVNSTGLTTSGGNIDIISQTDDINIQSVTGMSISVNNGALNLTSSGASINLTTDVDINFTSTFEIQFINPTETWFNTTAPNQGDGIVYGNFYGNLNGNATTATNATNVAITDNNTSATYYPTFVSNNTGNLALNVDKTTNPLSYIPSTGNLSSTLFTGLLSTGGLVYLSTGSVAITGSASATNISLSGIFNSTYKNYRIVLSPTSQITFTAYPSYSLQAFSGIGTMPTIASLYGFEMTSSATTIVTPIYTAGATISSSPLILAVSQVVNHQTIIEIENVGFTATTTQSLGLKCKSFYSNPGISGASDRSILASNVSGSTITGLVLQQNSISVGNNMTIGWTIYAYK